MNTTHSAHLRRANNAMHITITPYPWSSSTKWCATLNGFAAYDDSDPAGFGTTKEEALNNLWTRLLGKQKDFNELIAKGKPEIQSL